MTLKCKFLQVCYTYLISHFKYFICISYLRAFVGLNKKRSHLGVLFSKIETILGKKVKIFFIIFFPDYWSTQTYRTEPFDTMAEGLFEKPFSVLKKVNFILFFAVFQKVCF